MNLSIHGKIEEVIEWYKLTLSHQNKAINEHRRKDIDYIRWCTRSIDDESLLRREVEAVLAELCVGRGWYYSKVSRLKILLEKVLREQTAESIVTNSCEVSAQLSIERRR